MTNVNAFNENRSCISRDCEDPLLLYGLAPGQGGLHLQ